MSDEITILIIVGLAVVFVALWTFNTRQKRKYETERLARKRELEKLKADARAAAEKAAD